MKQFDSHVFGRSGMRTSCGIVALLLGSVWALPSQELQSSLDSTLESIDSRRGIQIGGTIRSSYLRSQFSSDQDVNAHDQSPDTERSGFSQLDLKLGFRPWETIRGNLVMRLAANYQDFFNAGAKTVSIPWVNVEGQVSEKFYWVAGDFRQWYSPLTLHSPDLEIMYEPEIYRRNRHMARDQVFLDGNKRNLQGANLQFRQDFGGSAGELRADVIFSRLRRTEILDFSGAMGNILPNDAYDVPGASQSSGMDKLLYGGNLEWLPLSRNVLIGLTPLYIKDIATSRTGVYRKHVDEVSFEEYYVYEPVNPGVLGPENATVLSGRLGVDGAGILGNSNLILNVVGEFAMSEDDGYEWNGDSVVSRSFDGTALLVQSELGYQSKGAWSVRAAVDFVKNDSAWYNPLAQSPSFFARRVANSDKDGDLLKFGAVSPFYSSFDALYHFVPKFSPVGKTLTADPLTTSQTESYNIAPFSKNSWNTGVYTRDELALIALLTDQNLQSALPNGLATANRVGPRATVTAGLGDEHYLEVQGLFTSLKEASATLADEAEFSEIGGGAKVDVGYFLGTGLPLEFSGSYKASKTKQGNVEMTSDFINGSFYAKYHKRFGVAAGVQRIKSAIDNSQLQSTNWVLTDGEQLQWMAGLDYSLARNAWLALNFGQIRVTNNYETSADPASAGGILPSYIVEEMAAQNSPYAGKNKIEHAFQQNLVEATINVDF